MNCFVKSFLFLEEDPWELLLLSLRFWLPALPLFLRLSRDGSLRVASFSF